MSRHQVTIRHRLFAFPAAVEVVTDVSGEQYGAADQDRRAAEVERIVVLAVVVPQVTCRWTIMYRNFIFVR